MSPSNNWDAFWARAKALGMDEEAVHKCFGIGSHARSKTLEIYAKGLARGFSVPEQRIIDMLTGQLGTE